ncbi:MAG: glycosyltransferase family 4 protein [Lachnospiraceae bacterium]|nr:glycosyltransferase family 4 protein [Lachnospiraceae bacterium]
MDILVISHFVDFPEETGNDRFCYIIKDLQNHTMHNVELVTSDFCHTAKAYHNKNRKYSVKNITFVHEPVYQKNISLKRFYSHFRFGQHVKKYLEKRKKPDVIYCAVPSLSVAIQAVKYAKKNQIRMILDVQDLWPEAFQMVFHVPVLSNLLFFPLKKMADFIYQGVDEIVAVSETYLNRAKRVNKKCNKGLSCFLGTELDQFDTFVLNKKDRDGETIKLVYIGTLGASYDIKTVIDAVRILVEKGRTNIVFEVLGDGPQKAELEAYVKGLPVHFYGRLAYPEMVRVLSGCDIAVNPIMHRAAQSIINKVGDYAAAGLPVINTLENKEYIRLLKEYRCGYTCKNGDALDMAKKIEHLVEHRDLLRKMSRNARRFAEEKFDRKVTYQAIRELICQQEKVTEV